MLLIDDDDAMVRLLGRILERSLGEDGLVVESVTDPSEALAKITNEVFDIVVTDFDMPEVSGLDILVAAKSRNASTQVLLITGHSSQATLLEAMERGATDYLIKPVDQSQFVELIKQAHDRHHRWREALAQTWHQKHTEAAAGG